MDAIPQNIELPETIGVIALPGTILFPNALLPLYIFEPRYREMLTSSLSDDRVFGVTMQQEGDDQVHTVGGAGLVRACVLNPDGTSHLILHGLARVRFSEWVQTDPYRIARIENLKSCNTEDPEAAELATAVRDLCRGLRDRGYQLPEHFEAYLADADSPEALSNAVCSTLIPDAETRQALLQELNVTARLRGFLECLQRQLD
ncbi:MAG: LON peptidase substrate-binding domain-containing protein [Chthoniobacterales bacterium]